MLQPVINSASSGQSKLVSALNLSICWYVASHPDQLSLAIPSWIGAMSTDQKPVTPCGWGVKAGMVRVWVAGKTVLPLLHAGHI